MTRCKACGSDYRKGVLAFLLSPGGLKGARVCQSCASGGVLLVAPKLGPVVKQKTVRSDGVERALRQMRTYAAASRALAKSYASRVDRGKSGAEYTDAISRAEGFEGAIEVLKRECGS
jgi:hypothetical protein